MGEYLRGVGTIGGWNHAESGARILVPDNSRTRLYGHALHRPRLRAGCVRDGPDRHRRKLCAFWRDRGLLWSSGARSPIARQIAVALVLGLNLHLFEHVTVKMEWRRLKSHVWNSPWAWLLGGVAAIFALIAWRFYARFRAMCRTVRDEFTNVIKSTYPQVELHFEANGDLTVRAGDSPGRFIDMASVYSAVARLPGMGRDRRPD